MFKNILISIKPEFVEKILNHTKTIEIRKTKPSCELPVKVYIYCTIGKKNQLLAKDNSTGKYRLWYGTYNELNGKVVAEFTLNQVDTVEICDPGVLRNGEQQDWHWFKSNACLDSEEMMSYIGYGDDHDGWGSEYAKGYAWHIDDLKIYDKPKELSEFKHWVVDCQGWCNKKNKAENVYVLEELKRPPQSYMFVETLEEV